MREATELQDEDEARPAIPLLTSPPNELIEMLFEYLYTDSDDMDRKQYLVLPGCRPKVQTIVNRVFSLV
jgi:hypothetical protein